MSSFPGTLVGKHFPVSLQRHKTFLILTSTFDQQNPAAFPFILSLSSEESELVFITLMEVEGGLAGS